MRKNTPVFLVLLLLAPALALPAGAQTVTITGRALTIRTPRLEATVENGVIVSLKNLATGEVHADRAFGEVAMPSGLGHLSGDPAAAGRLHMPWGTSTMDQQIGPGTAFPTMHRPHAGSSFKAVKTPTGVRATWTGLTNGTKQFPRETLTTEFWVHPRTGRLLFKAWGSSDAGGVYGVQVPLANLTPEHAFYVPSFGGTLYNRDNPPGLITLGGTPFWEAPVVAAEGRRGTLGLWVEDARFHPNFFFLNWTGKSFALAIEHQNLMPFEGLKKSESVTWCLDAFAGGWVDAMAPYKDWYARTFAPEMKARAATTKWADKIRVVIDHVEARPEVLREVASTFDPETVLVHEWNARAPDFDHELPDWTPRAGYPERVKMLQRHGFRTMAYVNTYCVNYNSPVFQRDRVKEFGLTRKYSGLYSYTTPRSTFETAKDNQLLYLDPLSARWRKYHTDMMLKWKADTGTDANYEDTGGAVGDHGNGVVEGKFGTQGAVEQFRELLRRNPSVPMASEYAPDCIAFAVRWPLRYQQVWGANPTREWWMERMRPVSAYIHGPLARPWIPTINAGSDFLKHVVVACSDALGGMAQFPATLSELRADKGILLHMKQRAQLFAHRQLTPVFPHGRWAKDVACFYRDGDGRVYRYSTNKQTQTMAGPDGRPLYQRVTGRNQVTTELMIPGWPAAAEGKVLGLNPAVRYALTRGAPDDTRVRVTSLPEGIRVRRFYETDKATVLALEPLGKDSPAEGQVTVLPRVRFAQVLLNDKLAALPEWNEKEKRSAPATYTTAFPAYLVFTERAPERPKVGEPFGDGKETGRYISAATGLERGGEFAVPFRAGWAVPGEKTTPTFLFINYGSDAEVTFDYLVQVPSKASVLSLYVRNNQVKYGNGAIARVTLNGRQAHAFDFGPRPNPNWKAGMEPALKNVWPSTNIRGWRLPVGEWAGQTLLVTIATDAKGDNNADSIWWARPTFAEDPAQQAAFVEFKEGAAVPEE